MLIKTLCLGTPPAGEAAATAALRAAAARLARESSGLREVQCLRVLRHIPTDSLNDQKSHNGVVPEADGLALVLEFYFDSEAAARAVAASPAWQAFRADVGAAAPVLFALDTQPNIPIAPAGAARDGGFRRWMLLARKAATPEQFRDAWFGRHADLVKQLPHVDGYLQNLVVAREDGSGAAADYARLPIDGIAELCFADEAAMNASYASGARLPLRDDGRDLLGRITTVLVQGEAWR